MARTYNTQPLFDDLGPAQIEWDSVVIGKTTENPEGGTHGGVIIRYNPATVDTMRDSEGDNPHDSIFVGQTFEIEANLAGMSLEQLSKLFPKAEVVGTGGSRKLRILNPVGTSMRAGSKELVVKPIIDGSVSSDKTDWFVFPLTFPLGAFELPFDLENQKVSKVTYKVFHDLTTDVVAEWSYSAAT